MRVWFIFLVSCGWCRLLSESSTKDVKCFFIHYLQFVVEYKVYDYDKFYSYKNVKLIFIIEQAKKF